MLWTDEFISYIPLESMSNHMRHITCSCKKSYLFAHLYLFFKAFHPFHFIIYSFLLFNVWSRKISFSNGPQERTRGSGVSIINGLLTKIFDSPDWFILRSPPPPPPELISWVRSWALNYNIYGWSISIGPTRNVEIFIYRGAGWLKY